MRWHSESWTTTRQRLEQWHRWFAWHPVRIGEERFWLEAMERKGELLSDGMDVYWKWEYREAA